MLRITTPSSIKSQKDWETKVQELILKARQHPCGSQQRNYYLTQIIRLVEPKLWKFYTPYYPDALQQTWIYFVKNVCTTYDPSRASVATWLNGYLKFRHQDLVRNALKCQAHEVSIDAELKDHNGATIQITNIPTREYGSLSLLDEIIHRINQDADGSLRSNHIRNHPEVNCQTLILLRLPPETPWKDISARFGVPIPTLSCFYQRNCIPYLEKLAQQLR